MTAKEKELADQLIAFMDCPCRVFEPMEDDDPIQEAYREAQKRGRSEGFTPILLGTIAGRKIPKIWRWYGQPGKNFWRNPCQKIFLRGCWTGYKMI